MKQFKFSIQDAFDVASNKVGVAGWKGYRWTLAEGGHIVVGIVPGGVFQRGPPKGTPNYSHPMSSNKTTVVLTNEELALSAEQYEESTGNCWMCKGSGKVLKSCGTSGTTYRGCPDCSETGKATK